MIAANKPLPKSKLVVWDGASEGEHYRPAPLDAISLCNGLIKFDHPMVAVLNTELDDTIFLLDNMYGPFMVVPKHNEWTFEQVRNAIDDTKAAGPPFDLDYGPTKGHVLNHMTVQQLYDHFLQHAWYCNATLKDELRPFVDGSIKDARFFVPHPVQAIVAGHKLFGAQNLAITLMSLQDDRLPIKIGLSTPGPGFTRMWQSVYAHHLKYGSALSKYDGSQHDSHVNPVIMKAIGRWRARYSSAPEHVERYYDGTYCGYINVGGVMVPVYGMPSGSVNTSHDNSLYVVFLLLLHCGRLGLGHDVLMTRVKALVMGDDLLISDGTQERLFNPLALAQTWNSVGSYLEYGSTDPQDILEMEFCGTHPCWRLVNNNRYLLYSYNSQKLLDSANYSKGSDVEAYFSKLCSLCQLLFADEESYLLLKGKAEIFWSTHPELAFGPCRDMLMTLHEANLLNLYLGDM